jgi:hypothetical protein
MHRYRLRRHTLAAGLVAVTLGLAGCNDSDGAPESDTQTPGIGSPSAPAFESPSAGVPTEAESAATAPVESPSS